MLLMRAIHSCFCYDCNNPKFLTNLLLCMYRAPCIEFLFITISYYTYYWLK